MLQSVCVVSIYLDLVYHKQITCYSLSVCIYLSRPCISYIFRLELQFILKILIKQKEIFMRVWSVSGIRFFPGSGSGLEKNHGSVYCFFPEKLDPVNNRVESIRNPASPPPPPPTQRFCELGWAVYDFSTISRPAHNIIYNLHNKLSRCLAFL